MDRERVGWGEDMPRWTVRASSGSASESVSESLRTATGSCERAEEVRRLPRHHRGCCASLPAGGRPPNRSEGRGCPQARPSSISPAAGDPSAMRTAELDGRALQLHTLALLRDTVLLPAALPDRVLQRLLVSRMAAWEAVDALERSRVIEQVGLRKGTLQQRLGLGLYHPRLDLATPERGHIQAGQRRRDGDGGWSRCGSGSVGRRSGRLTRRWNSLAKGEGWALVPALRIERRCHRLFGVAHHHRLLDPLRGRFL